MMLTQVFKISFTEGLARELCDSPVMRNDVIVQLRRYSLPAIMPPWWARTAMTFRAARTKGAAP